MGCDVKAFLFNICKAIMAYVLILKILIKEDPRVSPPPNQIISLGAMEDDVPPNLIKIRCL